MTIFMLKCTNKGIGENVEMQEREKQERPGFARRMQRENVRRMLIASVGLFVLFFIAAVLLQTQAVVAVESHIIRIAMALGVLYAGVYIWYSYRWLSDKKKCSARIQINLFWLMYAVLLVSVSFVSDSMFFALGICWVMTAVLAIVPLWNPTEFFVGLVIQIAAISCLVIKCEFGIEVILYLLANQLLCGIISRQSYDSFLQRAENEAEIAVAKNLSETDAMTSLLNRRGLRYSMEDIWPACIEDKMQAAVMMIDIDNFKKYNDYFGHLEGDNCIQNVAAEISRKLRSMEGIAARVGGEEFLVCLTGVEKEDALEWAVELKESIEALNIPQAADNFLSMVSVSIGIAWGYEGDYMSFKEMWKNADESLYAAKKSGRACICFDNKCYAKTQRENNRCQRYLEKGLRSWG